MGWPFEQGSLIKEDMYNRPLLVTDVLGSPNGQKTEKQEIGIFLHF